jgi:hypothetical protein
MASQPPHPRSGASQGTLSGLALGASVFFSTLFLADPSAHAGTPRVSFIYPGGGQRGAEIEVQFKGTNLADARNVLFDAPGFRVTPLKAEPGRFTAKVFVPAEAALGEHRCRVVTRSGVADIRPFIVSPFPMVEESAKPKSTAEAPQAIPPNTTVFGRTPTDEVDHYAVEFKKGQHLSIEVVGLLLHTQIPYDPEVFIFKPDGSLLAQVGRTAFGRGAPVSSLIAPEDGRYRIEIRDSTRNGLGECHYLMHVGTFARPLTAMPLGGPAGSPTAFSLLGDPAGPAQLSANPGALNDSIGSLAPEGNPPAPSPIPVRLNGLPNVLEKAEQPDAPERASGPAAALPAAFNGILSKPDETDYFRFAAKKGQVLDLRVYARSLRSPIDTVITVHNDKGAVLVSNDDSGGADSYQRWTVPAEGEYILSVKDQQNRGGPLFAYRVEVNPPVPRVKIALPEMTLNQSQDRRAIVIPRGNRYATLVRVKREDWAGGLQLLTQDLPPDVVATAPDLEKPYDTVAMVFEASEAAPLEQRLVEVGAKSLEAPEAPQPQVRVDHKVDVVENSNKRPYYSVFESRLPVVVTDPIPVKIEIEATRLGIVRSGQLPLKIHIHRTPEFKGPMELVLLHSPPGIGTPGPLKVPADAKEATLSINANADAPLKTWRLCVAGNADFGKGPVWFSSGFFELEVGETPFAGSLARTSVPQNGSGQMKLKIEPKGGFEGTAKVELLGLPAGVTAKPVEITPGQTLATFEVQAAPNATLGLNRQVVVLCSLQKNGHLVTSTCARNGVLRVDRPDNPPPSAPPAAPPQPAPAAAAPAPVKPAVSAASPAAPTPSTGAPAAKPTSAPTAPTASAPAPPKPASPAVAAQPSNP